MSRAARLRATFERVERTMPINPWAGPAVLTPIDITGLYDGPIAMTRGEAMAVPAVAGARNRLVSTITRMPLRAERDSEPLAVQPIWIGRADGNQSAALRMAGTIDDLLFYGESLWLAERDSEAQIIRATHCPYEEWSLDLDGYITVNEERIPSSRAIHIPGLHEGILSFGRTTIRGASRTMHAAVDVAEHPLRAEIHDTGDYPMTRDEQRELVAAAREAMASAGGVLFTTPGLETRLHQVDPGAMMVAGRESFAVDIARLVGIPSAVIDAHSQGSTMTYTTVQDVLAHFLHLGATLYMTPISARLSLDDISPRGTEIRFDLDDVLGATAFTEPQPQEEPA